MSKDTYNTKRQVKDLYKDEYLNTPIKEASLLKHLLSTQKQLLTKIDSLTSEVKILQEERIQKVEVTNPPDAPESIIFPPVQDVNVTNPTEIPAFPEKIDVTVQNPTAPADLKNVEKLLNDLLNKDFPEFPKTQKVNVQNQIDIPISKGDSARFADPSRYVPVRLTNGKRFYMALEEAYISAAKATFPFVNMTTGQPQAAAVDNNGIVQTTTSSGTGGGTTTTSGTPGFSYITNIPTIQSVFVTNPSSATVTTTSGTPIDVTIRNFPTVQTVIQSNAALETGGNLGILAAAVASNRMRVNISSIGGTNTSFNNGTADNGTLRVAIASDSIVSVSGTQLTISGSKTDVMNWPTVTTVNVLNQPPVTSVSGTLHSVIDNFPTVQSVFVTNPSSATVTTTSGTPLDVTIRNFPTVLTANINNLPNLTSVSGTNLHVFIDNFPTYRGEKLYDANNNQQGIPQNPLTISGTVSSPLPLPIFGQAKVTVSGTRVQFSSNGLQNGVIITANPDNLASVVIGGSAVNYTLDGTGNGDILPPGGSKSYAIDNTNRLYINGQATDWVSFGGS